MQFSMVTWLRRVWHSICCIAEPTVTRVRKETREKGRTMRARKFSDKGAPDPSARGPMPAPRGRLLRRGKLCFPVRHDSPIPRGGWRAEGLVSRPGGRLGYQRGDTTWQMEITQSHPTCRHVYSRERTRVAPGLVTGVLTASLEGKRPLGKRWSWESPRPRNLTDPGPAMTDSDWLTSD